MDNPEKQAILDTRNRTKTNKTTQHRKLQSRTTQIPPKIKDELMC
jgi:hypothetical protein